MPINLSLFRVCAFYSSINVLIFLFTTTIGYLNPPVDKEVTLNHSNITPFHSHQKTIPSLPELSGLTMTIQTDINRNRHKILWGHNDSGHETAIVALNTKGEQLLKVTLPVKSDDLEDIDTALCPKPLNQTQQCLWLADVGNNKHQRSEMSLIVFPVPQVNLNLRYQTSQVANKEVIKFTFEYPIEKPNVESFAIDHLGKRFWLFEKSDHVNAKVWSTTIEQRKLSYLTSLNSKYFAPSQSPHRQKKITGADFSNDGRKLILRSYAYVLLYALETPYHLKHLDKLKPILVAQPSRLEPQGEAVCYDELSQKVWTASEQKGEWDQTLHSFTL